MNQLLINQSFSQDILKKKCHSFFEIKVNLSPWFYGSSARYFRDPQILEKQQINERIQQLNFTPTKIRKNIDLNLMAKYYQQYSNALLQGDNIKAVTSSFDIISEISIQFEKSSFTFTYVIEQLVNIMIHIYNVIMKKNYLGAFDCLLKAEQLFTKKWLIPMIDQTNLHAIHSQLYTLQALKAFKQQQYQICLKAAINAYNEDTQITTDQSYDKRISACLNLAFIYYKLNQSDKAQPYIEEALKNAMFIDDTKYPNLYNPQLRQLREQLVQIISYHLYGAIYIQSPLYQKQIDKWYPPFCTTLDLAIKYFKDDSLPNEQKYNNQIIIWSLIELEIAERFAKKQDPNFVGRIQSKYYKDVEQILKNLPSTCLNKYDKMGGQIIDAYAKSKIEDEVYQEIENHDELSISQLKQDGKITTPSIQNYNQLTQSQYSQRLEDELRKPKSILKQIKAGAIQQQKDEELNTVEQYRSKAKQLQNIANQQQNLIKSATEQQKQQSVLILQTFYRQRSTQIRYNVHRIFVLNLQKNLRKVSQIRKQIKIQQSGAIIKAYYIGGKERNQLRVMLYSVIEIQEFAKKYLALNQFKSNLDQIIFLQNYYKQVYYGTYKRRKNDSKAAKLLQRFARSQQKHKDFEQQRWAATIIQSYIRGYNTELEYVQKIEAANTIQSCYLSKYHKNDLNNEIKAAQIIQKYIKQYNNGQNIGQQVQYILYLQTFIRQLMVYNAFNKVIQQIVKIQSIARQRSGKQSSKDRYWAINYLKQLIKKNRNNNTNSKVIIKLSQAQRQDLSKATMKQIFDYLNQQLYIQHCQENKIKPQDKSKSWQSIVNKIARQNNLTPIQIYAYYLQKWKYMKNPNLYKILQQCHPNLKYAVYYGTCLNYKPGIKEYTQEQIKAGKYLSRYIANKKTNDENYKYQKYVPIIQKYMRMQKQSQEYKTQKQAIKTIQNYVVSQNILHQLEKEKQAVIKIQTYMRYLQAKNQSKVKAQNVQFIQKFIIKKKDIKTESVLACEYIQGFYQQQKQVKNYNKTKNAIQTIQDFIRKFNHSGQVYQKAEDYFVYKVKQYLDKEIASTLIIQKYYRRYKINKQMKQVYNAVDKIKQSIKQREQQNIEKFTQTLKIIKLQKFIKEYQRDGRENAAAIIIQAKLKQYKFQKLYLMTKDRIIFIQAIARKRHDRNQLQLEWICAIKIQSIARRSIAQQKAKQIKQTVKRMQYLLVQSPLYQSVLQKTQRRPFDTVRNAALVLSRNYKQKIIQQEADENSKYIIKLQSLIRYYNVKIDQHYQLLAASIIQRYARHENNKAKQFNKQLLKKRKAQKMSQRNNLNSNQKLQKQFKIQLTKLIDQTSVHITFNNVYFQLQYLITFYMNFPLQVEHFQQIPIKTLKLRKM